MDTVRNRVRYASWTSTYCGVIQERRQFSWYNDWGKHLGEDSSTWILFLEHYFSDNDAELLSLNRSYALAKEHYLSNREDATYGATHYLTREYYISGKVKWAKRGEVIGTIGNHVFLKNVP